MRISPKFKGNIDTKLKQLLTAAKPEPLNVFKRMERIKRYSETEYYTTQCGWRFVVAIEGEEETRILVTAERICRLQNKRVTTCT